MNLPKISIVTPSFNQAKYLPETIESILNQGYPKLEYMIIDGGSIDGSVEIIKKYESHLSYWVSEKDDGQSAAIMKGFEQCSGELFAWVNSDDVLFPQCLEQIAYEYVSQVMPDLIHTNVCFIDSKSQIVRFCRVPHQSRFLFFRGVWHVVAPTLFYNASLFRHVGGLNNKYHLSMDLDLWMRMMNAGARVSHIPDYLGGYRWHESSKTAVSLRTRDTVENQDTINIYQTMLPTSSLLSRRLWRLCYKMWQVINLNYIMAYRDYITRGRGMQWHDVFKQSTDTCARRSNH